jgi:membrane dipeptidase
MRPLEISVNFMQYSLSIKNFSLALILFSNSTVHAVEPHSESAVLAKNALIVDTHIDVPFRIYRNPETDVTKPTLGGDFDLSRAKAGGLNVAFMSIYIPASVDDDGNAKTMADELINLVHGIVEKAPESLAVATCVSDIYAQQDAGLVSLPMGMENGAPIEGDLKNIDYFRKRGIRYITLAHSKSNHISDSSYDTNERWKGLSDFGKTLVSEMNNQGIMIDISHVTDAAAWQVLALSKTPIIASHSSLRYFVPGFHRSMTDEMVTAMAENGGVIQINFGSGFLTSAARAWSTKRSADIKAFRETNQLEEKDPAILEFGKQWLTEHPYPYATLSDVLDHIDRVVKLAGVDHVGIGSDYDGVGPTLPVDLKDVESYPNLVMGLRSRGYSDRNIEKILGGNLMRVWSAVERYAEDEGFSPICNHKS